MQGRSVVVLIKAQYVFEASDDTLLTRSAVGGLERDSFYTQRAQKFVIVHISHWRILPALLWLERGNVAAQPRLQPCAFPKRRRN
ncbi:hypothetical protein ALO82_200289 [Pseudomonas syringae pv. broussonetiae]|nr:hypothetical protein ALO82_200289 [Pseudomonas syringae pv. broussonetiae]